jgi:hypothetical protein
MVYPNLAFVPYNASGAMIIINELYEPKDCPISQILLVGTGALLTQYYSDWTDSIQRLGARPVSYVDSSQAI